MTNTSRTQEHTATVRGLTRTWLVLVVITVGSWWLAPAHFTDVQASAGVTAVVLVLTFVKSRLILRNFMEVRDAPRWLRRSTDGWLAGLLVTAFVIYLV